jgi:hypothetical protein
MDGARHKDTGLRTGAARRVLARLAALAALACLACLAAPAAAAPPVPGRALVVGVGDFADPAFPALEYAARDARRVAAYLADPRGGGFAPEHITVLTDQEATRSRILAETARLAARTRPGEKVFVYFSTHGFFTAEAVVGIVCHDSAAAGRGPDGPLVSRPTALTRYDLYHFLRGLKARERAVVVDLCHSAATAGGLAATAGGPPQEQPLDSETERGPDYLAGPGSGEEWVTLVLASCLGGEKAWESRQLRASIFTHYLLEGLRGHQGDLVRAFRYAQERTSRRASAEKGWCQTPYLVHRPPWRRMYLGPAPEGG